MSTQTMTKTKWAIDPTHSEITFKVKHMMFTNVTGQFSKFDVTAETDAENFANAKIDFKADVNSISTGNTDRDNHLKSADFFDAANHAEIHFKATSYEKGNGTDKLTGDLTIRNTTKSITLEVENGGVAKDPWGNLKAGFSITGKLNRKDFGLTWNAALETGGVLVSDEVKIAAEIQLVKQA
jgi:polyisoprenoid-binding protein YceI